MSDIEGFKKSKLDDIIEDENENLQEGLTQKGGVDKSSNETFEKLSQENELTELDISDLVEELEDSQEKTKELIDDVEDVEKKLKELASDSDAEYIADELNPTVTQYESDTTDTQYPTTDEEILADVDLKPEDVDIEVVRVSNLSVGTIDEGKSLSSKKKRSGEIKKSSVFKLFDLEYTSAERERMVKEILFQLIDDIHLKHMPDEDKEEEEFISWKKRKGSMRVIEDIKVNIYDLGKRFSEHGTEFSNLISHLWKKGKVKDALLENIEKKKNRKVKGESYMSPNPFILKWAHGFSGSVPVINLSKKNKIKIGFASAHSVVIYNYKKKKERLFQGHRNLVESISCDMFGKWIVSADGGDDNSVTVWDIKRGIPIKTYFSPYPEGTRLVEFDPSAAHIVTVSFGQQIISIWSWTSHSKTPEASFRLSCKTPPIKKICFCKENFHYFALLTESSIITCTYSDKLKNLIVYISKLKGMRYTGKMTDIVYVPRTHLIYTSTTEGFVVYWSDESFHNSYMQSSLVENKKLQIKHIKLQENCISVIQTIHTKRRLIITGDVKGRVAFYDVTLRILYWCSSLVNEPIISISFSCNARKETIRQNEIAQQLNDSVDDKKKRKKLRKSCSIPSKLLEENADYSQKFKIRRPPTDATLQQKPFLAMNFMISTSWGRVFYVEYTKCQADILYSASPVPVTAIVTHPYKHYVFFGNADGRIFMYDYLRKNVVLETEIKKEFPKDYKKPITSIAISRMGLELAIGLENGALHFYDPVLLRKQKSHFNNSNSAIRKIIFDNNSNYLVHTDDEMCVSLYGLGKYTNYMGKYKSHFEPITDIIITCKTSTLYSIAKDRRIAVYNIPDSFEGTLNLSRLDVLEQFALPLAIADYKVDKDGVELLIIATDEFKYKIYNTAKHCFIKTAQAPCLPTPINCVTILPKFENVPDTTTFMAFGTDNEIGIQMFPVDGNPYKALAYVGSATKLIGMSVSYNCSYMFTISENDPALLIWSINQRAVRMSAYYGGEGLHPYYCLLEGGYEGPMLKEMKEFFYYCQIVHDGEYLTGTRQVHDKMHLCDLTNFLNAVGYFPSLNETENILSEIKKNTVKKESEIQITFEEVIKIYLNHRPAKGVFEHKLRQAFKNFAKIVGNHSDKIEKNDFIQGLQLYGEVFSSNEIDVTLLALLGIKSIDDSDADSAVVNPTGYPDPSYYKLLPDLISYEYFLKEILGIDTSNHVFDDMEVLHTRETSQSKHSYIHSNTDFEQKIKPTDHKFCL